MHTHPKQDQIGLKSSKDFNDKMEHLSLDHEMCIYSTIHK